MQETIDWPWIQTQVAQAVEVWNESGARPLSHDGRRYGLKEQQAREEAYDDALQAVEREVGRVSVTNAERRRTQDRIVAAFARFSAAALDLEGDAIELLTNDFLPVGTALARWARQFDAGLSMADIIQACRNAWTACGLQPLVGERVGITPAILGYSLLYPYSDNYLDQEDVSSEAKLHFSERFRSLLRGERLSEEDDRERTLSALIQLIEGQYSRALYPQVFDCLLAIHRAQEESVQQLERERNPHQILRLSCAKGGSSVLADACLARGFLMERESRFAFEWGVLLQLGDDLQDVHEDMRRGSATLFSRAAAMGRPLDGLATQLLQFSETVGRRMDRLPNGSRPLKELLKMSWRSLIIRAVADSQQYFSPAFVEEAERGSPFRFDFLRARQDRLTNRPGLYAMLFEAFLEQSEDGCDPMGRALREYTQT